MTLDGSAMPIKYAYNNFHYEAGEWHDKSAGGKALIFRKPRGHVSQQHGEGSRHHIQNGLSLIIIE